MKKMIKLGLIVLGASALTFTMASATAEKEAPKAMKCQAGKCGGADKKKDMKCNAGKCSGDKKDMKKDMKKDGTGGKCGKGKCGGDK